ncbi:efflux RND transporter periplasmic adaptor subunit [Pantoea sp. A4]|uniref:efflux RND transporter periplasmic adaptor subunit n=1 Tax=Pantoea sp. A4 TaxID=1225184 RepID=UPI0008FAD8DF|nr:biotin/lipoyl-binding protein [Pantoea sp. A4]
MTLLRSRPSLVIGLILAAGLLSYFLFRQYSSAASVQKATEPLVSLSQAEVKSVPLRLSTQGHVVSLNQVDIQSQVTGTVASVAFKEGDFVKQGQLLFTLDDSTQQASLRHAVAALAESHSALTKAQNDVARGRSLKAKNYISASDWDTLISTQQQYAAQNSAGAEQLGKQTDGGDEENRCVCGREQ